MDRVRKVFEDLRLLDCSFLCTYCRTFFLLRLSMADIKVPYEIRRHAVVVAICTKHSDFQIKWFLKVVILFVHKVHKEVEDPDGDVSSVGKRKEHTQRSDNVVAPLFVQQVQELIQPPWMRLPGIAKCPTEQSALWCMKTYAISPLWFGRLIYASPDPGTTASPRKTATQQVEESGLLWFFSDEKQIHWRLEGRQEKLIFMMALVLCTSFPQVWWF